MRFVKHITRTRPFLFRFKHTCSPITNISTQVRWNSNEASSDQTAVNSEQKATTEELDSALNEFFKDLKNDTAPSSSKEETPASTTESSSDSKSSTNSASSKVLEAIKNVPKTRPTLSFIKVEIMREHRPNRIFELLKEIKDLNIKPDFETYLIAFKQLAEKNQYTKSMILLEEMIHQGFQPNLAIMNYLLQTASRSGNTCEIMLLKELIHKFDLELDTQSYLYLIQSFYTHQAYENVIEIYDEMIEKNLNLNQTIISLIICSLNHLGSPERAYQLLSQSEQEQFVFNFSCYLSILRTFLNSMFIKGVEKCWYHITSNFVPNFDEGLCLKTLNLASREGSTDLAADVIRYLGKEKYPVKHHHFSPLFLSFIRTNNFISAFDVLKVMEQSRVELYEPPELFSNDLLSQKCDESQLPKEPSNFFLSMIHYFSQQPTDFPKFLEQLKNYYSKSNPPPMSLLNSVVAYYVQMKELELAQEFIQQFDLFGLKPDSETYHFLIRGALIFRDQNLADRTFEEMKSKKIIPLKNSFEYLIKVSCYSVKYEDAFMYLETCKSYYLIPSKRMYLAIILRCAREKDPRAKIALDEMKDAGYSVDNQLREFVESAGLTAVRPGRLNLFDDLDSAVHPPR